MLSDFGPETAEDTREVGEALSASLRARDAVVLTGELGAGKTTFVQGVARGLGIEDQVSSPTFTLVKEYRGILDIAHVDVYRLERVQDVVDLGLEELGDGEGVLLVEWGDAVEDAAARRAAPRRAHHRGPAYRERAATPRLGARRLVAGAMGSRSRSAVAALERGVVIVLGIETSTPQTSVAIGTETEILAKVSIAGRARQEVGGPGAGPAPALERPDLSTGGRHRGGDRSRACSPACGSGSRPPRPSRRCCTCRSWASPASTRSPTRSARSHKRIAAVIDGRRGEVFFAIYRSVPGGVVRETDTGRHHPRPARRRARSDRRGGVGGGQRCDAVSTWAGRARKPDRVRLGDRRPSGGRRRWSSSPCPGSCGRSTIVSSTSSRST